MIDIHSHILPGIDDGAQSIKESIAIAKKATDEGITKIIATPHHQNGKYINKKKDIIDKVMEFNDVLQNQNIQLEVLPGQETRIYGELLDDIDRKEILTLNDSHYLFVELPSGYVPKYTEKLLFDLQMRGLTPIIVHPERNAEIIDRPEILFNLVNKGSLTQITAGSMVGFFGKKIKKFTSQLIDSNLTHFIASDVHNTSSRNFYLKDSLAFIEKEFGKQAVFYFHENSQLLVDGQSIYRESPTKIKRKKIFGFL